LHSPYLTVFALEEPENHLAPHYLSRIIRMVRSLTKSQMAQALFSSHSSATLNRIQPGEIRHFRLAETSRTSIVNYIKLPDSPEEEAKYVREAVVSYPEIYFSRFVVLVEGGSEQAVPPRLAQPLGLELDPSFIAIAPLGGRHVNHFWRLLSGLQIPYATLLDLDVGRNGGAWGRIKYACEQLLAVGVSRESLLRVTGGDGKESAWSEEEFQGMQDWDSLDYDGMMTWARHLEKFNVFFSGPLDLDLLMLYHFPPAYQAVAGKGQGPRIPPVGSANCEEILTNAARAVLGETGPGEVLYSGSALLSQMHDLFPWYRYLFLNKGKPSTHILALSGLNNTDLASSVPPVLQRLLSRANSQVNPGQQSIV
jgi:putative ATP-dependent endonuclease of the OLD family